MTVAKTNLRLKGTISQTLGRIETRVRKQQRTTSTEMSQSLCVWAEMREAKVRIARCLSQAVPLAHKLEEEKTWLTDDERV